MFVQGDINGRDVDAIVNAAKNLSRGRCCRRYRRRAVSRKRATG